MPRSSIQLDYRLLISVILVCVIGLGVGYKAISDASLLTNKQRINIVYSDSAEKVEFVSFDPTEKQILELKYPADLRIRSRSVGSYRVGDLEKLGSYQGEAGEFIRRKVQGFMKVPIMGYVIGKPGESLEQTLGKSLLGRQSSLSLVDSYVLFARYQSYRRVEVAEEELMRGGVIGESEEDELEYQAGRLQQFLEARVFDWSVGAKRWSVAVVNESGIPGLATEVADFLSNGGMDVVAVRSGEEGVVSEKSFVLVDLHQEEQLELVRKVFEDWFGWQEIELSETSYYRAEIVVKIGKEAAELF